ncbi:unnamed protein product [Ectocarpus sp. CCAP 1310/34]|nr:unnamed protein product [Ectocarpus sp. CCAP 1310/34]
MGRRWWPGSERSASERGAEGRAAQQAKEAGLVSAGGASTRRSSGGGSSSRRASSGGVDGDSGGGVGTLSSGDGNNSFFGHGDEAEDDEDDSDDCDGATSQRKRLQHGCCLCVGVAWTAALLLCLASGGSTAWGRGEALEAAAACALLGAAVLAAIALCLGLPTWSRNEDMDSEWCCCWLWRRGADETDDEGGKLAHVGGVTYLAI